MAKSRHEPPVHFLDRREFKGGEIPCGAMVTYKHSSAELRQHYTEERAAVTCSKCMKKLALMDYRETK